MNSARSTFPYKFSIICAIYNTENYISEAVESIINQDIEFCDSVELILVDDGSADGSGAICDSYKEKYPQNIRVIHKPNGGVSSARNVGLNIATGQFINFMDSDDKLSPNALSSVYNFFIKNIDEIDFVAIPIYYFEKKTNSHRLNYKFNKKGNRIIDLQKEYSSIQLHASSSFFKRECLNKDPFDITMHYAEDAKLIMQLLLSNPKYGVVSNCHYMYRYRDAMNSALNGSKLKREWYIDSLQKYCLWALNEAASKYGYIPEYVQYTIMYDLQGRFKVNKIPNFVMSDEDRILFEKLLFSAIARIDTHIILEQRNLSDELKDYIIRTKEGNYTSALEHAQNSSDIILNYNSKPLVHASKSNFSLSKFDIFDSSVSMTGTLYVYQTFSVPSEIYAAISSKSGVQNIPCLFEKDFENIFAFDGHPLGTSLKITLNIPFTLINGLTEISIYIVIDGFTIKLCNISRAPEFPVVPRQDILNVSDKPYALAITKSKIALEPANRLYRIKRHLVKKAKVFLSNH